MKKAIHLAAALALTLSACASTQGPDESAANSAIKAAKEVTAQAHAVGYEWRDTGKLIKAAEKAAKDGKYDEAVKLANKAKKQSEAALAQHAAQKNAGPNYSL